jgi:hypothetical protein
MASPILIRRNTSAMLNIVIDNPNAIAPSVSRVPSRMREDFAKGVPQDRDQVRRFTIVSTHRRTDRSVRGCRRPVPSRGRH